MEKRTFAYWLVMFIFLYTMQSALLPIFGYHGVSTDFLLLLTVSVSFLRGARLGVFVGFLAGLIQDLATGTYFGIDIFTKMLIGYSCGIMSRSLFKESLSLPVLAVGIATLVNYIVMLLILYLLGYRFELLEHLGMLLLPMLFYNLLFAYPVHRLVRWVMAKTWKENRTTSKAPW